MPPGAAPAPVEQQQQTKAAEEAAEVVEKSTADVVKSPVSDLVPKSDNLPSAAAKDIQASEAPKSKGPIRVVATRRGFYGGQRIEPGDTFTIKSESDWGDWMKKV